jgi:hypothetical protein
MAGSVNSPIVTAAATHDGNGMWLVGADGGIYSFGDAHFYGSTGSLQLQGPIVGMAPTPDGKGYWLVALDGGVFSFGDGHFYGSMGGHLLNQPIVAMASSADGKGYWLTAADGGIFAFGDAHFYGSSEPFHAPSPFVAMAATPDGKGYWQVAGDGGVLTFGDAKYYGSMGGQSIPAPVLGITVAPGGTGYTLAAWDGSVFPFGSAHFYGATDTGAAATPINDIIGTPDGKGYWLVSPDAYSVNFGNPAPWATFRGSRAVVAAAASQVQPDPDTGYFCNPYGPCEAWCALFATWALEQGGVSIPSYAFTGDVFYWGQQHGAVLPPSAKPVPGDAVLYGSGPWSTATSVHMGIVAQVWPDDAIVTVEGDAGPGSTGSLAVVINGPFFPMDSPSYNGMAIYAFVQP